MHMLKLTQIGNSVGVILPKEMLGRLKLEKGDTIFVTETPDGYVVTPHDPNFEIQMAAAQKIMKKRRNALHELAK
jgi:putative addiction module antidote